MRRATALRHAADCTFFLASAEKAARMAERKAATAEAREMADRLRDAMAQWKRYSRKLEEAMTR